MIFRFQNIFEGDNYTLTAYATGGKNIIINLDDCFDSACKQYNFTDGAAITVKTKRLEVGNKPGVTRKKQWIIFAKKVEISQLLR